MIGVFIPSPKASPQLGFLQRPRDRVEQACVGAERGVFHDDLPGRPEQQARE